MAEAKSLSAQVEGLQAKIDGAIRDCIYDRAAEISGVPVQVIKDMLIARSSASYCRCKALKNITEN
jgi:hypothetical protein